MVLQAADGRGQHRHIEFLAHLMKDPLLGIMPADDQERQAVPPAGRNVTFQQTAHSLLTPSGAFIYEMVPGAAVGSPVEMHHAVGFDAIAAIGAFPMPASPRQLPYPPPENDL